MSTAQHQKLNAALIGNRLVEAGFITKAQLKEALQVQHETELLFGEVCLLRGWITYAQLEQCLKPIRSRIGNKLLAQGLITMEQLWMAILEQRQTGVQLGKILVARDWISQEQLDEALKQNS